MLIYSFTHVFVCVLYVYNSNSQVWREIRKDGA